MTVRNRLASTFLIVGVLLVVPAAFAMRGLSALRDLAVEGRSRHAEASLAVGHIEAGLADLDGALRGYVATGVAGRREATFNALVALTIEATRIERAGYAEGSPELRSAITTVAAQVEAIDSLVKVGRLDTATDRVELFEAATDSVRARLQAVATDVDLQAQADFDLARRIGVDALRTTFVSVVVAIALALLLSAWTTGALTRPLGQLRTALARVTAGEFDAPSDLPYGRSDEIGELAVSFGIMSRRLGELDRLRAEFLGVAGHELKTPINVIRGYTELIEEGLAGELTDSQREMMGRIAEQTQILTRQVGRLMDISRLESGTYVLVPESVRLTDLIHGVERSFEVVAREKGVCLKTEIVPGAPERIVLDPDLIRDEVLANLVSNAVKFTPSGGEVTVRAWADPGGLVIEVSDTGCGIPFDHRPYVFEKYYQVERSYSTGSAGLGLAIAREMAEVHGGSLNLVEGTTAGTAFRLSLPLSIEPTRREINPTARG